MQPLRGYMTAAPLKHSIDFMMLLAQSALRGYMTAAPLKQPSTVLSRAE